MALAYVLVFPDDFSFGELFLIFPDGKKSIFGKIFQQEFRLAGQPFHNRKECEKSEMTL